MRKLDNIESFYVSDGNHLSVWKEQIQDGYFIVDDTEYEPKFTYDVVDIYNLYISKKNISMMQSINRSLDWVSKEELFNKKILDIESFYLIDSDYRPSKYYNGEYYKNWPKSVRDFHEKWNLIVWNEFISIKNKLYNNE